MCILDSMIQINTVVEKISRPIWVGIGLFLLGIIAFLDYITGPDLSLSLFYLFPIALIAWAVTPRSGLVAALLSDIIWMVVDILSGDRPNNWFVYGWNACIRLSFFVMPVLIIRLLRAMERERMFARTDFLTGVLNTRFFHELAQMEINRSVRYQRPFTIVFIDVDNFKTINDTFGHTMGDTVLRTIALNIQQHLRKTDSIARVGGDEFVALLPETDASTAPVVLSNMQQALMHEMQSNGWPVTFSIGALTLEGTQISVDELLGRADQLMYMVKNGGKNNIHYASFPQESFAVKIHT
jgi:diguanylate cyclase (GGDEF)-like protein